MNVHSSRLEAAGLRRTLLTIITVFAVFMAAAMGFNTVPKAGAQDANPAPVTFGEPTVTQNGQPIEKQLDTRDRVSLSFPWTATGDIASGQTMTIEFPGDINPPPNSNIPFNVGTEKAGTCAVENQTLVCTFEKNINQDGVTGTIGLNVGLGETPGPDWNFTVPGGAPLSVAIPGGSVVPYKLPEGKEDRVSKYGTIDYTKTPGVVDWTIIVPAEKLTDANGQAKAVRITDQLESTNHAYVPFDTEDGKIYVYQENSDGTTKAWPTNVVTVQDGGRGFAVDITPQAGGWNPEWDLKITYKTVFTGTPKDREKFENAANVVISDSQGNETTTPAEERNAQEHIYDSAAAAAGSGVERGSYALTKTVIGDEACVAQITEPFQVNVEIDVNDSAGPNFQFPRTVAKTGAQPADGKISYNASIRPGTTFTGYDSLPQGSKVTITEVKPEIEGVEFADPEYKPGQTVTIENSEENATIELTNTVLSCTETDQTGGNDGSSPSPWWLLLIPAIPVVGWLISKIPGLSSTPTVPGPGRHGSNAPAPNGPALNGPAGDAPAPAGEGNPSAQGGQAGVGAGADDQAVESAAPGGQRQTIQSVPSGATVKGAKVPVFIG